MKKSLIITGIALLTLLFFLQYQQRKNAATADINLDPSGQNADNIPGGVLLPAEATAYAATGPAASSAEFSRPQTNTPFTPPTAMAGKGPIVNIPKLFAQVSICPPGKGPGAIIPKAFMTAANCPPGRSLNGLLSSHGTVWGYLAFGPDAFSKAENDAVYGLLAEYFSCQAVLYGDMEMCNYLPGVQHRLDRYFTTPNYKCVDPSTKVLFYAYAAGKFKSDLPCRKFFTGDNVTGANVPPEFCREVSKGFAYICDAPQAGSRKARCHEAFPSSPSDCKTPVCMENFNLYSALKDSNMSGCPDKYKNECGAFFTKSPAV